MEKPDSSKQCYYAQRFIYHLSSVHCLSLETYLTENGIQSPLCECGCGNKVLPTHRGKDIRFADRIKYHGEGNNPKMKAFRLRSSQERMGSGNPMYGKKSWNSGKTKDNNDILRHISEKTMNHYVSDDTRRKQSASAKKRLVHGHTGHKHSEESKEKMRQHTLKMIRCGRYPQTRSKPCIAVSEILDDMDIEYREEEIRGPFSFDFYIPSKDVFIEVDGDYFHSNPIKFPNGPKTSTQRRNAYRDMVKARFSHENGYHVIHIWEYDINNDMPSVVRLLKDTMK
jgi:G:T-mismatch repair DNA endonuclease (very short patch repair protein)